MQEYRVVIKLVVKKDRIGLGDVLTNFDSYINNSVFLVNSVKQIEVTEVERDEL